MHHLSKVAMAAFMLIAAAIACDSPTVPHINIERSAWSSDSKRIALVIKDDESVGEVQVFDITRHQDHESIATIKSANYAVWTSSDTVLVSLGSPENFFDPNDNNLHPIRIEGESPVWSPDGTKVAYLKCNSTATCILYIADSDGQNPHQLTGAINLDFLGGSRNCQFSWSLDSKQIAFSRQYSGISSEIEIISVETQNIATITESQYDVRNVCPIWLQNGQIAFLSDRDEINPYYYDFKIYSINSDGSELQQLSDYEHIENISASPDGSRIAFMTLPKSGETEGLTAHPLHVINFDGTGHKLLRGGGGSILVWSPNGQYLTYQDQLSSKITVIDSTSGAIVWEYQISVVKFLVGDIPEFALLFAVICCIVPLPSGILFMRWLHRQDQKRKDRLESQLTPPFQGELPV